MPWLSNCSVTSPHGTDEARMNTLCLWHCVYDKVVFGNHFDDFWGRSRCLNKILDEVQPKPFQLALERSCILGTFKAAVGSKFGHCYFLRDFFLMHYARIINSEQKEQNQNKKKRKNKSWHLS